jgi:hypothetical protein
VHAPALSCRVIRPFIRAVFCQVSRPERLPSCPARAKCVAPLIAAAPIPGRDALTRAIACRRMALRSSQAQHTCMTLGDSSHAQKVRLALLLLLVPVGLGFRL